MKKNIKISLSFILLVSLFAFTCNKEEFPILEPHLDSNLYGEQIVTTSNLRVTYFRNGDEIPHAQDSESWRKAGENKEPAWAFYDNDSSTIEQCGLLYNWFAVNDPRGLAPQGWHIPTKEEWKQLGEYFAKNYPRNVKPIKSKTAWVKYENGDNSSGFNAFPCGYRSKNGVNNQYGDATAWWSSSKDGGGDNSHNSFIFSFSNVYHEYNVTQNTRTSGLSVRCMKY